MPGVFQKVSGTFPDKRRRQNTLDIQEKEQGEENAVLLFIPLLFRGGKRGGQEIMTGYTHMLAGLCAGIAVIEWKGLLTPGSGLLVTGGILLGSILPDIDNRNSTVSHRLPVAGSVINMLQKGVRFLSYLLPGRAGRRIRETAGHRGITHSLLFPALLLLCPGGNFFILGTSAGIMVHILLDMLSGGVPLFLPFSGIRITLGKIRTGGILDTVVIRWGLCGLAVMLLAHLAGG